MINQFIIIIPEILLASLAIVMQIVAVYVRNASKQIAFATTLLGLGVVYYLLYFVPEYQLDFTLFLPLLRLFRFLKLYY